MKALFRFIKMIEKNRKTKGTPDYVDKHVGAQLRARRSFIGISQEKLADAVGITFQQIQKYERGANRVSAGRLYSFSQILDVPVNYFYSGIVAPSSSPPTGMSDTAQEGFDTKKSGGFSPLTRTELEEILDTINTISNDAKRQQFLSFVKKESKKYI